MLVAIAVSQEAVMPDSYKTAWQAVQEEPPDKLYSRDGDCLCALFLSVLGGEGHHAVFKFFDPAVGNGHPVGVASQVFENMFGAFDRVAHTDHPIFCIQHILEVALGCACKFERTGFADMPQALDELAAKDL